MGNAGWKENVSEFDRVEVGKGDWVDGLGWAQDERERNQIGAKWLMG